MARIWTLLLFGVGVAAILLADPRLLREAALGLLLAAALLAAVGGLFLARKGPTRSGTHPDERSGAFDPPGATDPPGTMDPPGAIDPPDTMDPPGPAPPDLAGLSRSFILPGTGAFLLSVLYWYRAALGVGGFEDGFGFRLAQTYFFWVPAVVFISLYRAPGEGLGPSRRSTFLLRILTAVFAGLLGMTAASQIHAWHDARYDRTSLADAVSHLQRHIIPDDVTVSWSHSRPELTVELSWPLHPDRPSYQELRRIRSLADRFARLSNRHDTDTVTLQMTRDDQVFAALDWSAHHDGRPWDQVRIDHETAGITPWPGPDDIRHVMDGIPPTARTERLHSRLIGDTLHFWRAGTTPPGATPPGPDPDLQSRNRQAAPSTRDNTGQGNGNSPIQPGIHPELHPDTIRAIAQDWRALNHVIRDIRSVFRDIPAFGITMPGYPAGNTHHLHIPATDMDGYFQAQRFLPVPAGHALIQLSDTTGLAVDDTGIRRSPVRLVWNDGRFGPSHNDITLWPWSRGTVGLRFHVFLLDVDPAGNVTLFLESLTGPDTAADPGTVRLEPGQTIDLNSVYLAHLGWRRTDADIHP